MRPLYIIPKIRLSFRAFLSCSLTHLKYAFFSEIASKPNKSCGSWVMTLAIHFNRPHIVFWILMIFFV